MFIDSSESDTELYFSNIHYVLKFLFNPQLIFRERSINMAMTQI